jgi:hypothetical protein
MCLSEKYNFGICIELIIVKDFWERAPGLRVVFIYQGEPDFKDLFHLVVLIRLTDPSRDLDVVVFQEFDTGALGRFAYLEFLLIEIPGFISLRVALPQALDQFLVPEHLLHDLIVQLSHKCECCCLVR